MPDRSLRRPPLLLRERRSSPTPPRESDDVPESGQGSAGGHGSAGGDSGAPASGQRPEPPRVPETSSDDNPFAPPPEGSPDQPWQPRRPAGGQGQDGRNSQDDGDTPWGSQWSDRQPGPAQDGRFGDKPGSGSSGGPGGGQGGPEGRGGPGTGMRWDPTDPAQRHARFALLSGMWAFFFALFSWPYVALLLGALALHWAISALRAKSRPPNPDTPAPSSQGSKPQATAAISGLVTASLALVLVAMTFTAQLVYRDYYTCVNDSLTNTAEKSCDDLLPDQLQGLLGTRS
ncbi:hypothetical protein AB0D14_11495 [Streptomyces sp. NPDC048484]|uniref:hypothetical protein n=1 Tax=Streptomyces sp. NPDC048484 TaxID=3155146 RepID=UPI0034411A4A